MYQTCLNAVDSLVYPPVCLHCRGEIDESSHTFCHVCLQQFVMVDPSDRCLFCFSETELQKNRVCAECVRYPTPLRQVAAVFDYAGPPATIVKRMKYGNMPGLSKTVAAYMVQQLITLDWPVPDVIVPVPIPWAREIERGYNQSFFIAEELGRMFNRPAVNLLGRKSGEFSQAGLSREQRMKLRGESFYFAGRSDVWRVGIGSSDMGKGNLKCDIEDRIILIVDDVLTTGSTLRRCGERVLEGYPAEVYGLTFCRAV